jgi:hypothetical protein
MALDLPQGAAIPRRRWCAMAVHLPLDDVALKLLNQALGAGADEAIATTVVLSKLCRLYPATADDVLRNALARAWALHRQKRRGLAS